jgi:hypothetical protein
MLTTRLTLAMQAGGEALAWLDDSVMDEPIEAALAEISDDCP